MSAKQYAIKSSGDTGADRRSLIWSSSPAVTFGFFASRSRYRGKTSLPPKEPRKYGRSGTPVDTVATGPTLTFAIFGDTRNIWSLDNDCQRAGRSKFMSRGSSKVHCWSNERQPNRTIGGWSASGGKSASGTERPTRVWILRPVLAVSNLVARDAGSFSESSSLQRLYR